MATLPTSDRGMEGLLPARVAFATELSNLEHDVLLMGSRAETMVGEAALALSSLDTSAARRVLAMDDDIDARDLAIETACLRILALHNPMASDLRTIGTVMKIITDLERVGDLAVDLARITLKIDNLMAEGTAVDLLSMATAARTLLRESLEAFARRDIELVASVCRKDEAVDQKYRDLRGILFERMRQAPEEAIAHGWTLLAIHHVERIADHGVNIAERVGFMVTGRLTKAREFVHGSERVPSASDG